MRKKLLLLVLPLFLFSATLNAQDIMYWDFGARELGPGYKNMLPLEYLNNWAGRNSYDIGPEAYGRSVELLNSHPTWGAVKWTNPGFHFGINVTGADEEEGGGVKISGGSDWTKPTPNLPLLDDNVNMAHRFDSSDDRLLTVRRDVTRHDERELMPNGDAAFASHFPGCLEFTTSGTKRPDRGLNILGVPAGATITIVGAGVLADDDDNEGTPEVTGAFTLEPLEGFDTPLEDQGAGSTDTSVRVIKFVAASGGDYKLGYKYGKVRFYRIYLGDVDPDIAPSTPLVKVIDFGAEFLDGTVYDNLASVKVIQDACSEGVDPVSGGTNSGLIGQDLRTNSIPYDLAIDGSQTPLGLGNNHYGNYFTSNVWFIHNSVGSDRLRSTNDTELTVHSTNVGGGSGITPPLTGRIYVNSDAKRDRYFSIRPDVDGQEVTIIFQGNNVGSPSTINIQGVDWDRNPVGSPMAFNFTGEDVVKALRVTLPSKDVDYQIWDSVGKLSVFRIYFGYVDFPVLDPADNLGDTLSTSDIASTVLTNVRAIGNRVYVSNVKSNTEINIYSITGALVKSLKTDVDTDFEFNSGLFIATIKTPEGKKSVKFVTK